MWIFNRLNIYAIFSQYYLVYGKNDCSESSAIFAFLQYPFAFVDEWQFIACTRWIFFMTCNITVFNLKFVYVREFDIYEQ